MCLEVINTPFRGNFLFRKHCSEALSKKTPHSQSYFSRKTHQTLLISSPFPTPPRSNSTYTDSLVSRQLNIFPIVEGSFQDETTTRHVSLYPSTDASLSSSRYLGPIYDAWANSIEGDSRVVYSGEVY